MSKSEKKRGKDEGGRENNQVKRRDEKILDEGEDMGEEMREERRLDKKSR